MTTTSPVYIDDDSEFVYDDVDHFQSQDSVDQFLSQESVVTNTQEDEEEDAVEKQNGIKFLNASTV